MDDEVEHRALGTVEDPDTGAVDPVDRLPPAWRWGYEAIMAALAITVLGLFPLPDEGTVRIVNLGIWMIFLLDYAVRLVGSGDRRRFLRTRVADLVAILPADLLRLARLARLARLVRLVRVWAVVWRSTRLVREVLATNGLGWVLLVSLGLVVAAGMAGWIVEPDIDTVADGLWWSLVTATTVGYGDISPESGFGRLVAAGLMLVGIGVIGLLTATFATYFIDRQRVPQHPHVEFVCRELQRWDQLAPSERRNLVGLLDGLVDHRAPAGAQPEGPSTTANSSASY